jgi:hypothetical protein
MALHHHRGELGQRSRSDADNQREQGLRKRRVQPLFLKSRVWEGECHPLRYRCLDKDGLPGCRRRSGNRLFQGPFLRYLVSSQQRLSRPDRQQVQQARRVLSRVTPLNPFLLLKVFSGSSHSPLHTPASYAPSASGVQRIQTRTQRAPGRRRFAPQGSCMEASTIVSGWLGVHSGIPNADTLQSEPGAGVNPWRWSRQVF